MLSLHNINPMARSIGTMGVVAALVGGITFANLNSNTVYLSPNNLTTATAGLLIGPGPRANSTSCTTPSNITTGVQDGSLVPNSSTSVTFCINNDSSLPLSITANIPQDLSGSVAAQNTTFTVDCGLGGALTAALSGPWGPAAFPNDLGAGKAVTCTATAMLNSTYTGSGGETIPQFEVDFVGNQ